jgi:hypothetical protein
MTPRKLGWPETPLAFAAAVIVIGGALLAINLLLFAVRGHGMKLVPDLYGVVRTQNFGWTPQDILDGNFESGVAHDIGPREPFYPAAVRLRNQLEFSLLDTSPIIREVRGRDNELLERVYLDDYCSRDLATFLPGAPAWAAKIRQMQDKVQAEGKVFLYVVTPSKVAQYPEWMPARWPCPSTQANRLGLVPAWNTIVQRAGIHEVDTTATLWAAHGRYPFPLFPQGGTHWNDVGSALGAQAVEAGLLHLTRDPRFTPFSFTWTLSDHPAGTDIDLASLLNVMWPPVNFTVPVIKLKEPPPPPGCRRLRIVIIGGSFMLNIEQKLDHTGCGADAVAYEYWSVHRVTFDRGNWVVIPVDPAQRDRDLRAADVIIYEEDEQVLGHAPQGPKFYNWLMRGKDQK